MDVIIKHIEKITTPIFMAAIYEKQRKENKSLVGWIDGIHEER